MKAKQEIVKNLESINQSLSQIKQGMDLMTEQEIQSARIFFQEIPSLKDKSDRVTGQAQSLIHQSASAVNEIMIQCQIHDILSQRIEHVIHNHQALITEISQATQAEKYTTVLPDIFKLNRWQTEDVQRLWAMNIKLIVDSWKRAHTFCQMLIDKFSTSSSQTFYISKLRQLAQHSAVKSSPPYDELFMSAYWQEVEIQFASLSQKLHKESFVICPEQRLSILKTLEKHFTMQAERDLLLKLLQENELLSEEEMISDTKDSDDFSELF